jgi:hypothetical protein
MKTWLKKLDNQLESLVQVVDSNLEPLADVTTGAVFTAGTETIEHETGQQPLVTPSVVAEEEGQLPQPTPEPYNLPTQKPSLDYTGC